MQHQGNERALKLQPGSSRLALVCCPACTGGGTGRAGLDEDVSLGLSVTRSGCGICLASVCRWNAESTTGCPRELRVLVLVDEHGNDDLHWMGTQLLLWLAF